MNYLKKNKKNPKMRQIKMNMKRHKTKIKINNAHNFERKMRPPKKRSLTLLIMNYQKARNYKNQPILIIPIMNLLISTNL